MAKHTVLLGISGSIAAYRMCDLILDLREEGIRVVPVFSRDAHHFVTPLMIQSLASEEVYGDMFLVPGRVKPVHIELAKAADLILLAPATADIIARSSLGLADDLLSATVLAASSPVIFAPAMNDRMYANPATQEHIERLKKRGYRFIEPIVGKLVCSDRACGHIADNAVILKTVLASLGAKRGKR